MLDTMNTAVKKLFIRIERCKNVPSNGTVADIVKEIILNQLRLKFNLSPEWDDYLSGCSMSNAANDVCGSTAALNCAPYVPLWAMTASKKDKSEDSIQLCYALCRYDHLAGSIHHVLPAPLTQDSFLSPVFFDQRIRCMCGSNPYPVRPLELSEATLPDFINYLQDEMRSIPIALVSCPDVVSPDELLKLALGNLIVFWTDDPEIIEHLNTILPEELHIPWDSVRMLLPIGQAQAYHPVYTYESICQLGIDSFLAGIHQAFCSCLRSEERRGFITVADIARIRDRRHIASLHEQVRERDEKIAVLGEDLLRLESEKSSLAKKLTAYRNHPLSSEIKEYEELLNETLSENSAIKEGITSLSSQLYATLGHDFQPNETETIAVLQELAHAIRVALACAHSKNKVNPGQRTDNS